MSKLRLGVYGTLRKGMGNYRYLLDNDKAELVATIKVPFEMRAHGIPFMLKKDGNTVLEVFEIDESLLPDIDRLEGHREGSSKSGYVREYLRDSLPDGELKDEYGDVQVYFYYPIHNKSVYNMQIVEDYTEFRKTGAR